MKYFPERKFVRVKKFVVEGGRRLCGSVKISGAKNAALPILFSLLLTRGESYVENLPDIGDVRVALAILSSYGVKLRRTGESLIADTRDLTDAEPDESLVRAIRASSYLLGGALARFGRVTIRSYGGCNFADRPIDMHLSAAEALGALRDGDQLCAQTLRGGRIVFEKISVGATVNALLLAATAQGMTEIYGAAKEPHVGALISFLNSAGADIREEEGSLTVHGTGGLLSGGRTAIIPDAIEAGTYLLAAPLTGGEITVAGAIPSHLGGFLPKLRESGVRLKIGENEITASGLPTSSVCVTASPHPGFPTDLQPQFSVLLSQVGGRIRDSVFPERFGYLSALSAFGVRSDLQKQNGSAVIYPSELKNSIVYSPDLRGGAACLLAALAAEGESEIRAAYNILRGYLGMQEKLPALGACVALREET